ncbi:MAG TPA: hypothetical protein VGB36_14040 [Gammaproteobacteria bacterium]
MQNSTRTDFVAPRTTPRPARGGTRGLIAEGWDIVPVMSAFRVTMKPRRNVTRVRIAWCPGGCIG